METAHVIEVGDCIKACTTPYAGVALRRYHQRIGRQLLFTGWVIRNCHGLEDVIDDAAAELVAKSDAWYDRVAAAES